MPDLYGVHLLHQETDQIAGDLDADGTSRIGERSIEEILSKTRERRRRSFREGIVGGKSSEMHLEHKRRARRN